MSPTMQPSTPNPPVHRILMLHGHGQSGPFFRCKTRFLQEAIEQAVRGAVQQQQQQQDGGMVEFYYPSGLLPANPDSPLGDRKNNNMWAWGYGDHQSDRILGLEQSVQYIARLLETHGPFIGVMGFSTGAALAAITAVLLERQRTVCDLPFDTTHPRLQFAVCFSGFRLEHPSYAPLYQPGLATPVLHVIGTLDTMVDPALSRRLIKACAHPSAHYFAGTHYVPRSRRFLETLAGFIDRSLRTRLAGDGEDDDVWEDEDGV